MAKIDRTEMEQPFSHRKNWIEDQLDKLEFVEWDRWYELTGNSIAVYGWIDREDQYKDFVLLELNIARTQIIGYHTSSEKYTEKIADLLNMDHSECKRVENYLDVQNVIALNDTEGDN